MAVLSESDPAYKKARRLYYKSARNKQNDPDWTPFRAAEKHYKARFPPPDLSNVLDIATLDESRAAEVSLGGWQGRPDVIDCRKIALQKGGGKGYIFPSHPGLVLLPGYLSHDRQRELTRWALRDHARKPNETNLDTHYILPEKGLWNAHIGSLLSGTQVPFVQPKASSLVPDHVAFTPVTPGPRQLISNDAASTDNIHTLTTAAAAQPTPPPSLSAAPASPSDLIRKLRWANIGWFYNWTSKQYDFTKEKVPVASTIKDLCQNAVEDINWHEVFDGDNQWGDSREDWMTWNETYEPDAGIVNFYQTKDTLMAHVDRSEVCATTPLVSISLGCAAVFLIGGLTRDAEPTPILLRSGDVVIMSGPACRRAYHGVPRILENTLPAHLCSGSEDEWQPFGEYLSTTRININVRQVFPKGFKPSW